MYPEGGGRIMAITDNGTALSELCAVSLSWFQHTKWQIILQIYDCTFSIRQKYYTNIGTVIQYKKRNVQHIVIKHLSYTKKKQNIGI